MQNFLDGFVVALRWAHIVAILGWVGASLYFMWLDSKLRKPDPQRPNVLGEAWMGHGGGFYIVEKRHISPGQVPSPVYWFRNEAAVTWVTGFLLLVFVYYWHGGVALVETDAFLSPGAAIAVAIGTLVVCWLIYDTLWASTFSDRNPVAATVVSGVLLLAVVYLLCEWFSGRAAYIHVGAVIGTCMVGNVWRRIIPAQVEAVSATSAGRERDPVAALRARRRAQHNTYLTLPVIFTMIAAHAPSTYSHSLNWLIMALMVVIGAGARHMMILYDRQALPGKAWLTTVAPVAVAAVLVVTIMLPQRSGSVSATASAAVPFSVAHGIVELRCVSCHTQQPASYGGPPAGIRLDTPDEITRHAAKIHATTVATRAMPPGNSTRMTDEERALLGRWIAAGGSRD